MSYQVLARKWRPQNFTDVVGQQHVLTALSNGLTLGRLHHAYLFSGTRGVGKTSIARLLAKGLNCESGITAKPCGKCDNCREIEEGRFVDLIEIDAASRTKVEDTRELLDNVQYAPVRGRFKIYLIDEVHMLSRHSFNALLKTLEEPPPHVKFLLATTDPQKLPVTILSRCLQFHLKALEPEQIQLQLEKILGLEQIPYEQRALLLLARAADGSMRDALSLTDQAIASGGGNVSNNVVAEMLGTLDNEQPLALLEALINTDATTVMTLVEQLASRAIGWDNLLQELLAILHQVAMLQLLPIAVDKLQQHNEQRLRELARRIPPQDLQLYYQIILVGRKELAFSPNQKMGVEMTLLRVLAFHPKQLNETSDVFVSVDNEITHPVQQQSAENKVDKLVQLATTESSQSSILTPAIQPTIPQSVDVEASESMVNEVDQRNDTSTAVHHASTASILQARNKLIQQQKKNSQTQKKSQTLSQNKPAVNPTSVLERFVNATEQHASDTKKTEEESKGDQDEPYQWKAKHKDSTTIEPAATPKAIRSALEFEKTPELAAKLAKEAALRDPWAAQINHLLLPKLVQQLALNAYKQQINEDEICLHLRSSQRHLNSANAQQVLTEALSKLLNKPISLTIIEDDNPQLRTPIEWRQIIYDEMLSHAQQVVVNDKNIKAICTMFNAELDKNSIRPI